MVDEFESIAMCVYLQAAVVGDGDQTAQWPQFCNAQTDCDVAADELLVQPPTGSYKQPVVPNKNAKTQIERCNGVYFRRLCCSIMQS